MSNIKKIRQEIERRIKSCKTKNGFPAGTISAIRIETYEGLLAFIDSLPEEIPPYITGFKGDPDPPGISDLEQAAARYEREMDVGKDMTLNDLIRKATAVAGQLSSGDLELRLIDAITADASGRKIEDIFISPYSEDGMMKVGISFETEKNEKKVISESRGIIEGFDVVNGSPTLSLRTSVMSYESCSIEDAVIRLPYTGRIDDVKDIFVHGPGRVRIIVESEY